MKKWGNWLVAALLGTILLVWDIFSTFELNNVGEVFSYLGPIHLALWVMMVLAFRLAFAAMSFAMSGLSKIMGVNEVVADSEKTSDSTFASSSDLEDNIK